MTVGEAVDQLLTMPRNKELVIVIHAFDEPILRYIESQRKGFRGTLAYLLDPTPKLWRNREFRHRLKVWTSSIVARDGEVQITNGGHCPSIQRAENGLPQLSAGQDVMKR